MDCSSDYIEMCRKATEIQNQKPDFNEEEQSFIANFHDAKACPTHGEEHLWTRALTEDFYCTNCGKELVSVNHIPNIETYEENGVLETVWLPRQDQLQNIVKDKFELNLDGRYYWHKLLATMLITLKPPIIDWSWSMEQLWLAFVMYEKYDKKWSGAEWKSDKKENLCPN